MNTSSALNLRRRLSPVLAAVAAAGLVSGWMVLPTVSATAATVPVAGVVVTSVDICHATNSDKNPYVEESPSVGAIITLPNGHKDHTGPVWTPGIVGNWGDIIPPFTYDLGAGPTNYPGLNWSSWGQAIFKNGCNAPTTVTPATPTVVASSCAAGVLTSSSYTVPSTTGLVYKVDGVVTAGGTVVYGVAPATDTLTAEVSSTAYYLATPFSVTMSFLADAPGCTQVTAVAPIVQASFCSGGVVTQSYYDVPSPTGIIWKVGPTVVTGTRRSGTAPATETLVAEAAPGYVLTAPFSQTMTFLAAAPGCTPATAATPAIIPSSCTGLVASQPSFTIPNTIGVTYSVDTVTKSAGDVVTGVSTTKTLTAVANTGYDLTNAPFSVSMVFGALATGCAPPPPPTAADLGVTKVGPTSPVKPGENVAYVITVTNSGNGSASDVSVTDALLSGLAFVSASGTGFTCSGTSTTTCQYAGSLAPGASAVLNLVATLSGSYGSTTVVNTATVLPTDNNPANNTDTETTAVTLPIPPVDEDLGVSKTGLSDSVAPGDVMSWAVQVTNVTGTPAAAFTVVDVLPEGLTPLTAGGDGWSCSTAGQTVTCTYTGDPLLVGTSSSFQVDAVVAADFAGTSISNTAVVDPGGVDAANDSSTVVTPVVITGGGSAPVVQPEEEQPAPVPGPVLPFTGSFTDSALTAGVALLTLGLLLALVGRRRRTA